MRSTRGLRHGGVFDLEIVEQRPGFVVARITGDGADRVFGNEAGGHRWQRIPPTEKRGRVHTSTITVATFAECVAASVTVATRDIEWSTCRGSGAGGQKRNKTESTVIARHLPTGITVRCETERSQDRNRKLAYAVLCARVHARIEGARAAHTAAERRAMVGSGMRGDKRRTIRTQDGVVRDHVTGRSWRFADYERGMW